MFERAIRAGVKNTVRRSPELRREARSGPRWRKEYSLNVLLRLGISALIATTAWVAGAKTGHPATALAVVTLWSFFLVFIGAQRLLTTLYADTDLHALSLLPVEKPTIFRWQFQKFLRRSFFSLLDLLCGFAAVAWWLELPATKWLAVVPLIGATWLMLLALEMLAAVYFPSFPYHLVYLLVAAAGFVLLIARDYVGPAMLAMLDRAAPQLNVVLPTGWPVSLFQLLLAEPAWLLLVLVLPTAAVILTIRHSIARLQNNYDFHEIVVGEAPDLIPDALDDTEAVAASPTEAPWRVGLTSIEDIIRSRQFMAAPQWESRGWLEGVLGRWLTTREKRLGEFVFPDGFTISRPWKRIGKTFFVAMLSALLVSIVFPSAMYWILVFGLFITVCQVLGRVLDNGHAFQPVLCGGVNIPVYAVYPIGYRELGRLLMKYSLVQLSPLLAFTLVASMVTAYMIKQPILLGVVFGLKIAVLLLAARPFAVLLAFSSTTNDTSGFRLRVFALVGLILLGGLLFLGLAAGGLFWPARVAWVSCAAAALQAYGCFRIYGWFYNRNRFDLMNLPKQ